MNFSENLKEAMFCKNITSLELAQKTGIKIDTINSYLKTKGTIPSADKAVRIAQILGVTVEFLVTGFMDSKKEKSDKPEKNEHTLSRIDLKYKQLFKDIRALPEDLRAAMEIIIYNLNSKK